MKTTNFFSQRTVAEIILTLSCIGLVACSASGTSNGVAKLPDDPSSEIVPPPSASKKPSPSQAATPAPSTAPPPSVNLTSPPTIDQFSYLDPNKEVPASLLHAALQYYVDNYSSLGNRNYITVVDFSLSSTQHRMWVISIADGSVWALPVAHGKGSDANGDGYAETFSNTPGSEQSSLGIYVTAETYDGDNGYSLRIDGMSPTDSNARSRDIVVHGAAYVEDANIIQGRSWGCFAVPLSEYTKLIDLIKDGSVMYAGLSGNTK